MRPDLEIIQKWIEPKSRVLDLGCGDGALLTLLKKNKKVDSIGLEIDAANIQHCIKNGVNVIEQNLDKGLSNFETDSFDKIISMGCGVNCPNLRISQDWNLEDPHGREIDFYRETRDKIFNYLSDL